MSEALLPPDVVVDLTNCDREPIHQIGSIQPHGLLLAFHPETLVIEQISENAADWLEEAAAAWLGQSLLHLHGLTPHEATLRSLVAGARPAAFLVRLTEGGEQYQAFAHHNGVVGVLEIEPREGTRADTFVAEATRHIEGLNAAQDLEALGAAVVHWVRACTGFDRVMLYQFLPGEHGVVLAEEAAPGLEPYLGLYYPASDIPRQARLLFERNQVRVFVDVDAAFVPITPLHNPRTRAPLDLSDSVLRGVSPMHVEYLQNMGVGATLSIALVVRGRLWGLVACHHQSPHFIPEAGRQQARLIAQVAANRIIALEDDALYRRLLQAQEVQPRLLDFIVEEEAPGNARATDDLNILSLLQADGAAVVIGERSWLLGTTPSLAAIRELAQWLGMRATQLFETDHLSRHYAPASQYTDAASGLLALALSEEESHYILWFRREYKHALKWAGNPDKPVGSDGAGRLTPRKSFEAFHQVVEHRARPWAAWEVGLANVLGNALLNVVTRLDDLAREVAVRQEAEATVRELNKTLEQRVRERTAELEAANAELESFSYSVSHDLRSPVRHLSGYLTMLEEELEGHLDGDAAHYLDRMGAANRRMGQLIDDLLAFSRSGRVTLTKSRVALDNLVQLVRHELMEDLQDRQVRWTIGRMPAVYADPNLLRLVLTNLLNNALKFTQREETAAIEVAAWEDPDQQAVVCMVKDNGVGFDMAYADKLFGVFQRLHKRTEFEGTGIGLANVRRIITRHGGRTWAEGALGTGARFYFSLPVFS